MGRRVAGSRGGGWREGHACQPGTQSPVTWGPLHHLRPQARSELLAVEEVERWSERLQSGLRAGMEHQLQVTDALPGKAPKYLRQFRCGSHERLFFRRLVPRLLAAEGDLDRRGALQAGRITADADAGLIHPLPKWWHGIGPGAAPDQPIVPQIGPLGPQTQHPRSRWHTSSHQDRWPSGARAARPQLAVPRLIVRAGEVDLPLAQERGDDGQRLLEAGGAVVEGVAEGAELRFVIAGPQAQNQPAAADLVDRVGHFGQ